MVITIYNDFYIYLITYFKQNDYPDLTIDINQLSINFLSIDAEDFYPSYFEPSN